MPIVGCFIFGHGGIILDPANRDFDGIPAVKPTSKDECIKLHEAMKANAESLVDTRPDLIILSTPHGVRLKNSFLFLGNSKVVILSPYITLPFHTKAKNSVLGERKCRMGRRMV